MQLYTKKHENMEIVIIIAVASLLFCWYELCIRIGWALSMAQSITDGLHAVAAVQELTGSISAVPGYSSCHWHLQAETGAGNAEPENVRVKPRRIAFEPRNVWAEQCRKN